MTMNKSIFDFSKVSNWPQSESRGREYNGEVTASEEHLNCTLLDVAHSLVVESDASFHERQQKSEGL